MRALLAERSSLGATASTSARPDSVRLRLERAGVEATQDRKTYVTVHAYAPATVQRAIAAGAKCIEHAHLMDEATAKLMAEKDIWLSISALPHRRRHGCFDGTEPDRPTPGLRRHG